MQLQPAHLATLFLAAIVASATIVCTLPGIPEPTAPQSQTYETYPYTTTHTDQAPVSPQASAGNISETESQSPTWLHMLTADPRVLAYKWYRGRDCPIGNYSTKDDRYIFDKDDLSELESQGRDPNEKVIGARALWSPTGIICIAISEEIHPTNLAALHEIAHAIVYLEHGLDGHNEVFDDKLAELALIVDRSMCPVRDLRLKALIARSRPIWGPSILPTRTPQEQQLFDFCYPPNVPQVTVPTQTPTPVPTSTPSTPQVNNTFLQLSYDASQVMNNRQVPVKSQNCAGGSKRLTKWSRTLPITSQPATIRDADGWTAHVVTMEFARIHPGRGYLTDTCPSDEIHAWVTMERDDMSTPNMTGYTVEWRDINGHLIATDTAHDGIRVSVKLDQNPEPLFEGPATLLIYDRHTGGSQPTPTPARAISPEEKTLIFDFDPTQWDRFSLGTKYGFDSWHEYLSESPDLLQHDIEIIDAKSGTWTLSKIEQIEKRYASRDTDYAEYTIYLTNSSRGMADFTGYNIELTGESDVYKQQSWHPVHNARPMEQAQFTITIAIPQEGDGPLSLRIWDTYEPALQSQQ